MKKLNNCLFVAFLFFMVWGFSQERVEREHRILKSQFPPIAYPKDALGDNVKKLRYYKEVAADHIVYSTKFKKDRLHYQMKYTKEGELQSVAFFINEIDVPTDVYAQIVTFMDASFDEWKLMKMAQLYPVETKDLEAQAYKNAFQNLMVPNVRYKLEVKGKKDSKREQMEFWFTATGSLLSSRDALPANFDRVLY